MESTGSLPNGGRQSSTHHRPSTRALAEQLRRDAGFLGYLALQLLVVVGLVRLILAA